MSKPAKVYAVQVPARRDGPRGGWVEKFDLSPAREFGEVVRLLPYGNIPNDPGRVRPQLREALRAFDFRTDYLLLLGDPVACAMAVHILGEFQDTPDETIKALKWDKRSGAYQPYVIG